MSALVQRIPNRTHEAVVPRPSYKDVLARRQRLDPHGIPVWPLQTQDWPSRTQERLG